MSNKEKNGKENILFVLCLCGFAGIAILASIKRIFVGLDIDEQYAVALVYRMIHGDIIIKEMWEPHQTSAIIVSIPAWIYIKLHGNSDYLLLFLRGISVVVQSVVAVSWYLFHRKSAGKWYASLSAFILFMIIPKFILAPEFNNMQVWFFILEVLFLLKGLKSDKRAFWIVAGAFILLEVMAYPSCVLLYIFFVICMMTSGKKENVFFYSIPAIVAGVGLMVYLYIMIGVKDIPLFMKYILSDGTHSNGCGTKLFGYLVEVPIAVLYISIYAVIAGIVCVVIKAAGHHLKIEKSDLVIFAELWTAVSFLDQFRFWMIDGAKIGYPQYCYLVMFISGVILYMAYKEQLRECYKDEVVYIYFGNVIAWISVMLLTNLSIKATFIHLLPGCALSVCIWGKCISFVDGERIKTNIVVGIISSMCIIFMVSFGAGYIVRTSNEGRYNDINMEFKKIIYGPAKNIYCEYLEGYSLNLGYELLSDNIEKGSKLLYLGAANLVYMAGDFEVCTPSTISTPTYDDTLRKYYELNPEKTPEYVAVDMNYTSNSEVMGLLKDLFEIELIASNDYMEVYKVNDCSS